MYKMNKKNLYLLLFIGLIIITSYFLGVESAFDEINYWKGDQYKEESTVDTQDKTINEEDIPRQRTINKENINTNVNTEQSLIEKHNTPIKITSTTVNPGTSSKLDIKG